MKIYKGRLTLAIAILATMFLFVLSLGAVGAQDLTPTPGPEVTPDPADLYNVAKLMAEGTAFPGNYVLGGITFTVSTDNDSIMLLTGNGWSNAPYQMDSKIIEIGGANSSMYVLTQKSLHTFSTANNGFNPTNQNATIMPSDLVIYGHGDGCVYGFQTGSYIPVGYTVVAGGNYSYGLREASACNITTEVIAANLRFVAASESILASEMKATEYDASKIMAGGTAYANSFELGGYSLKVSPTDPTTVLVSGGGFVDAARPQNDRVVDIGGNGNSGLYILTQHGMTTYSVQNGGFAQTNLNVTILPDGMSVYTSTPDGLVVFQKGFALPFIYKVQAGGQFGFTLTMNLNASPSHDLLVVRLKAAAAEQGVTTEQMLKNVGQ